MYGMEKRTCELKRISVLDVDSEKYYDYYFFENIESINTAILNQLFVSNSDNNV